MVEKGRYSLNSEFPLLLAERSARFSSPKAPVRPGQYMPAIDLIEIINKDIKRALKGNRIQPASVNIKRN